MEIKTFLSLKRRHVAREVGNELEIIPLTDDMTKIETFYINETGKFIWNAVSDNSSLESLAEKMVEEYNVDLQTAHRDIEIFFKTIEKQLT
jgi:hypothetical protein